MPHDLVLTITSDDERLRHRALVDYCRTATGEALVAACAELDEFRRGSDNLYHRVRALFFLAALYRYHLPPKLNGAAALVPFTGYVHLLQRRFDEAIDVFLAESRREGISDALASALAVAYYRLGFQTLADQVRRSVRSVRGNQWMFRTGHPADHALRIDPRLIERAAGSPPPILVERTPVRMDLSHSGWSDIFFLGMDFPEGARVLNVSVDLAMHGRDPEPLPPIEVALRVIDVPVLRLVSVDLKAMAEITTIAEVFEFAKDYLGLLKAGIIAAGLVPAGLEGSGLPLTDLLRQVVGPGRGLEIVSHVREIPKGSRLAVSTNLLAAIIAVCMRATGQVHSLTGSLDERERQTVAARAILGEWLGGSGGGWQDSGGVWPGIKMIEGCAATPDDPEWGISRGRLLPRHTIIGPAEVSPATRALLHESFVLVHGGMAQNVGPILEMVTEKYLLREPREWVARQEAMQIIRRIDGLLRQGDLRGVAAATLANFCGPIRTIIPWASNHYTETLIERVRAHFEKDFWGFLMLGGMSGGGMGFIVAPQRKREAQEAIAAIMQTTKQELQSALPFAMEPAVYDFAINDAGTVATLLTGNDAFMPAAYYAELVPAWLRSDAARHSAAIRDEINRFAAQCRNNPRLAGAADLLFAKMFPPQATSQDDGATLQRLLTENGFDVELHEQIRADLRTGRIGLAQNRLSINTVIEDVRDDDVVFSDGADAACRALGAAALARGEVAVVTLAAGAGSRWTQGAGVVKALHPFHCFAGRYRNFLAVHLAKSRATAAASGALLPHVFTTSYLTHDPIAAALQRHANYAYPGPVLLSRGRAVGLRVIPMPRDLRFAWEETPQQLLDAQAQKALTSLRAALIDWAQQAGPGSDYTDNLPHQCLHPVGHWFEIPNLLRNGTLARLLERQPRLKHLMLHNIDTLGANVDPGMLGLHLRSGAELTFEVLRRRVEDRGGGLARVDGRVRLVESLAMPREEDEFRLTYYNSMTTWIDIDQLLERFALRRSDLNDELNVTAAIRRLGRRMPTYITLKDVKKRWGYGQEDVFPVAQFEKLWSDMTVLPDARCQFVVVPRMRGQQLKEQAQLDSWLRDGSADYVETLCAWEN